MIEKLWIEDFSKHFQTKVLYNGGESKQEFAASF